MISLVQMEYIVAVANTGQFSAAAEKCFVTQPTLSMAVKKLESDLDLIIFDRSKQPVVPTEIGTLIIEQARKTLAESRKIEELIKESKGEVSGHIRLGIIPSVSGYLVPLFVGNFLRKYPSVQLTITELLTEDLVKALRKEEIDVGILSTPLKEEGITEKPLYYEEILIYTNEKHQLHGKKEVKLKDLQHENAWLLSNGHCFRNQVINLCSTKEQSALQFNYESASLEALMKLVDTEGGLTLIPQLAIPSDGNKVAHRTTRIESHPIREISLVYSRSFVKEQSLKVLKEEILDVIPKNMKSVEDGLLVEWN